MTAGVRAQLQQQSGKPSTFQISVRLSRSGFPPLSRHHFAACTTPATHNLCWDSLPMSDSDPDVLFAALLSLSDAVEAVTSKTDSSSVDDAFEGVDVLARLRDAADGGDAEPEPPFTAEEADADDDRCFIPLTLSFRVTYSVGDTVRAARSRGLPLLCLPFACRLDWHLRQIGQPVRPLEFCVSSHLFLISPRSRATCHFCLQRTRCRPLRSWSCSPRTAGGIAYVLLCGKQGVCVF